MNIIVFTKHRGSSRQFDLKRPATLASFAAVLVTSVAALFLSGFLTAAKKHPVDSDQRIVELQATIDAQSREIANTRLKAQENLEALSVRIGRMQAQ